MKQLLASLTMVALLLPVSASALSYNNPSALFQAIEDQRKPQSFDMEFHINSPVEDMYVSFWIVGGTENVGTPDLKMKARLTVHVNIEGDFGILKAEAMAHQQKLYMRVTEIDMPPMLSYITLEFGDILNKWTRMDIPAEMLDPAYNKQQMAELISLLDLNIDPQEFKNQIIDAVVGMTHNQFENGHAYSIKLHPNLIENIMRLAEAMDDEAMDELSVSDLMEARQMLNDFLNLHIKIDTDTEGELAFMKFYVSFTELETDMEFVFQGNSVTDYTPVYLEVPTEFEDIGDLENIYNMDDIYSENVDVVDWGNESEGMTDEEWEAWLNGSDDDMMYYEDDVSSDVIDIVRTRRLPVEPREPQHTHGDFTLCDEEPGTLAYMALQRRGVCETDRHPSRSR